MHWLAGALPWRLCQPCGRYSLRRVTITGLLQVGLVGIDRFSMRSSIQRSDIPRYFSQLSSQVFSFTIASLAIANHGPYFSSLEFHTKYPLVSNLDRAHQLESFEFVGASKGGVFVVVDSASQPNYISTMGCIIVAGFREPFQYFRTLRYPPPD